jgi:Beta-propeller repeat
MDDVFVAKFDLTRAKTAGLLFSTYLGGNDVDTAWGLAADSAGNAYVVGQVFSKDFPTVLSFQAFCSDCTSFTANPRSGDGFLFKLGTEASVQVGYAKATILVIVACVLALGVSSFRSWSRIQK